MSRSRGEFSAVARGKPLAEVEECSTRSDGPGGVGEVHEDCSVFSILCPIHAPVLRRKHNGAVDGRDNEPEKHRADQPVRPLDRNQMHSTPHSTPHHLVVCVCGWVSGRVVEGGVVSEWEGGEGECVLVCALCIGVCIGVCVGGWVGGCCGWYVVGKGGGGRTEPDDLVGRERVEGDAKGLVDANEFKQRLQRPVGKPAQRPAPVRQEQEQDKVLELHPRLPRDLETPRLRRERCCRCRNS